MRGIRDGGGKKKKTKDSKRACEKVRQVYLLSAKTSETSSRNANRATPDNTYRKKIPHPATPRRGGNREKHGETSKPTGRSETNLTKTRRTDTKRAV